MNPVLYLASGVLNPCSTSQMSLQLLWYCGGRQPPEAFATDGCQECLEHLAVQIVSSVI